MSYKIDMLLGNEISSTGSRVKMNRTQIAAIEPYIEQIIAQTEAGTMTWRQTNPSTFIGRNPLVAKLKLR